MFDAFTQDDWIRLGVMVLLAGLPAIIWSILIFRGRKTSRWTLLLAFFSGHPHGSAAHFDLRLPLGEVPHSRS